ncbi:MAG TPA: tetratricopeptide repeat protein [Thermoleophilia bacterium]|nr:tetratricopeptide repeat protein [Thermoleophilia bacterium]
MALRRAMPHSPSAAQWYERGYDLEEVAFEEAVEAYRRALEVDPDHVGAHVNLGRLLHLAGDVATAEAHYRRAIAAASADAIAWFNLAVVLEDRGSAGEALAAYDRALAVDPGLADAHHNSARLCERLGRPAEALRRLSALRRLML